MCMLCDDFPSHIALLRLTADAFVLNSPATQQNRIDRSETRQEETSLSAQASVPQ